MSVDRHHHDSGARASTRSALAAAQAVLASRRPERTATPRLPPLRFQMRRTDLLRLAWVHPRSRNILFITTLAAFRATPGTSKLAIVALSAALAWTGIRMDYWAFGLLVVVMVWSAPILFAKGLALRYLARKLAPCRVGSECDIEVVAEGLKYECHGSSGLIAWTSVESILPSRPLLLLRHAQGDLVLPCRAFVDAHHRDNLLALLALRSGHSPKWVYLPAFVGGSKRQ